MTFREVKPISSIESLFEDEKPMPSLRGDTHHKGNTPALSPLSFLKIPDFHGKQFVPAVLWCIGSICLIGFGALTTGTFYGPESGKFAGILAVIFYQFQLGTMVEFGGIWFGLNGMKKLISGENS